MDTHVSPYSDVDDIQELVRFNCLHDAQTKLRALRASTPQKSAKKLPRLLIDAIHHHQLTFFLEKEYVPTRVQSGLRQAPKMVKDGVRPCRYCFDMAGISTIS